ncbi:molybdopterin-dependent oxidoreductase [Thermodesulfatator autotrophicus]|uniref:Molybdopterin oxidoreductase n=1 Tax=Thermodesulfatator autotrophicus TaxID=1795632 RepID=A0A177E7I7_9BACT|nr:molybdopterin-dependent oxidoreductase [Thermodesulfatator autotrophicus]OAG27400.1 molybdopterin oxidoreductase [Thermodesulfatator autotrophicus]
MKRRTFIKMAGFLCLVGPSLEIKDTFGKVLFKPVLIWDSKRCIRCRACMASCQMVHQLAPEETFMQVLIKEEGEYPQVKISFKQEICRQCQEAPCLEACPEGAIRRDKSGIVLVDKTLCVGDGACENTCPYSAIKVFREKAYKCDMCFHLISQKELPRCVAVCPSGALVFGNLYAPEGPLAILLKYNSELAEELKKYQYAEVTAFPKVYPWQKVDGANLKAGERLVTTVCLACNARCGLRVWVRDENIVKVEGNPYHPYNRTGEPISYKTPLKEALKETAGICAKPLFDHDYLNNPYRLKVPLKRNGPRGSGKFKPISWSQLIHEISEGGKLFVHLGDGQHYPGLKELLSDEPIDPSAPEIGPKRNQLVWITGRSQGGRKHFIKRFVNKAFGSVNYIGHTDICGLGFRMGNFAFSDGKQVEFKADLWNTRYALVFGANLYAALQPGPTTAGSVFARRAAEGKLKFVIIDPRAHEATAAASEWVPIKPGKDGALALGLLYVLLKEKLFDSSFLSLANLKAAKNEGRNVFTNATHLVITEGPEAGRFLRVKDLKGFSGQPEEHLVVDKKGKIKPASEVSRATLFWEGTYQGFRLKTAFKLLEESVFAHDMAFYARESGVPQKTIERLAREFAENAPYSAAFAYHGGGNYVGGAYASYAIALLNAMVGNVNRVGGYLCSGGGAAKWETGCYNLKSFPGAYKPRGIKISREKAAYEKTSEFKRKGYPSKLPWFPFTKGGLSVSALAGIDQAYPYPIKVLFTYFYNPVYTTPGGKRFAETLKDHNKVPLHVSVDITVNETNIYADYIVPDITYLEGQYGFLNPHAPAQKFTAVRTPVLSPRTEKTPDGRPYCLETFLIDLAKHLNLPGFGPKAIKGPQGLLPLERAEDYYLRGIANLALNAKVKEAPSEERAFIEANYPVAAYKHILSNKEWAQVCTVLARGGVFLPPEKAFDSKGNLKKGIPLVCIWNEKMACSKNSLTGENFWGTTRFEVPCNALGQKISEIDAAYPFFLISHKTALHTQSRTICYRQALAYEGEPLLLLNPEDAKAFGLKDGSLVKISSRSYPEGVLVRVKCSSRVRPGIVAYPFHYGHTQHGASSLIISQAEKVLLGGRRVAENDIVKADSSRRRGFNPNIFSRLDEALFHLPLLDPLGGIPDFSSTRVSLTPVKS